MRALAVALVLTAALATPRAASQPCAEAALAVPAKGAIETRPRPLIAWPPIAGTTRYRVQLESRVANGPVIARIDQVITGTQFTPPQALAQERAVVKVRVSAACEGESQGTVSELGPAFFVDVRGSCPAPRDVRVRAGGILAMDWVASAAVRRTEISIFSAADGKLIAKEDALGGHREFALPKEAAAVALRSRCAEAVSETVYRVVSATAP